MQFLDAWALLAPADLARLLGVPVALLVAALLPGRGVVRLAAVVVALLVVRSPELGGPWGVALGWALLWGLVAWLGGGASLEPRAGEGRRSRHLRTGFESSVIALPLGGALVVLTLAGLARQQMDPLDARRAAVGALVVGAGVLHLMLRRHVRRATLAFAAIGLGLELLLASARAADPAGEGPPPGAALLGAAMAVALALRVAVSRERYAGSPLVPDAHDLRD